MRLFLLAALLCAFASSSLAQERVRPRAGMLITNNMRLISGDYMLEVTSDDCAMIHEDWTWHPPRLAVISISLNGDHQIRIEHFEMNEYATLVASIRKAN